MKITNDVSLGAVYIYIYTHTHTRYFSKWKNKKCNK